ncbi:MAG: RipA family octameric membrane protein [Halocynthiibacter sp.]
MAEQTITMRSELSNIYATYVQTISANESRRQNASNTYITLLAALCSLLATNISIDERIIAIAVGAIALIWWRTICYFKELQKAKFAVVTDLEDSMGIRAFELEWKKFNSCEISGDLKKGPRLTTLEMQIPKFLFMATASYLIVDLAYNFFYFILLQLY